MKRLLVCITTGLCLLANIKAQSFYSIPVDSVYWVEYSNGPYMGNTSCWQQVRRLIYPTTNNFIYGGKTFTEYRCTEDWSFYSVIPNQCPSGFVVSDIQYAYLASDSLTKTVYRYDSSLFVPEVMIFDFSQSLGDTITYFQCSDTIVITIEDSIDIGGEYRRRLGMNGVGILQNDTIYLIEGIGSNYGLAFNSYCPFEYMTNLVCYHYKDLEYGDVSSEYCTNTLAIEDNVYGIESIFQYAGNDTYRVKITEGELQLNIYDLHGKIVHTAAYHQDSYLDISLYPNGVYIATAHANGKVFKPFKFVKVP